MLSSKEVPYTGLYSNDSTKHDSSGPTVVALKRAISRLGFMDWKDEFTERWPADGALDQSFREWQKHLEMPANGVYGEQAWKAIRAATIAKGPKKGEYGLDANAQKLIQKEWEDKHVKDEDDARAAIAEFCRLAEANEDNWHYRLARPLEVSVDPTGSSITADCSMYVIQAYHYAREKTGIDIPDPSKQNYTGYGNTDLYEDDHPHVSEAYNIGDLAHYDGHVTLCRKAGTAETAVFSSHGQESGPMPVSLHYRSDFRFVVRPPLKM
jgi:hypothetical protein